MVNFIGTCYTSRMSTYHLYPVFQARIVEETLHAWKLLEETTGRVHWLCKKHSDRNNQLDQVIWVRYGDQVTPRLYEQKRAKHFVEQTYTYLTTDWGSRQAFPVVLHECKGPGWVARDQATGLRVFIPNSCMNIAREIPGEMLKGMTVMAQMATPVEYCAFHENVTATLAQPERHAPDALVTIELLSVESHRICFKDQDGYLYKASVKLLRSSRDFKSILSPGQQFIMERVGGKFPNIGAVLNERLRQWLTQQLSIGCNYEGEVDSHYLHGVFIRLAGIPYTAYVYLGDAVEACMKGQRLRCIFNGWDEQGRTQFQPI